MPQLIPSFPQYFPKLDLIEPLEVLPYSPPSLLPAPTLIPTPTPQPTYVPYPVPTQYPTQYPTYTSSPTVVQPTRYIDPVQQAAIDPTLLILGGAAIVALFLLFMKK